MLTLTLPKNVISYIKGLMCVFENASCMALSLVSKRSRDSLTRVLEGKKFCWQILLQNFILRTFGKLQGGYLIIDDTIISKVFAKSIENLAWVFDSKIGRSILGLNIVLIAWSNSKVTIPLALKVYQKGNGKTKIDLAVELIRYAKKLGLKPDYITFDSWYAAKEIFETIKQHRWEFVTQIKSNRKLNGIPLKEVQRNPYWMMTGKIAGGIKVVVVRNGKKYFATNDLASSRQEVLSRYKGRWTIETIFKALHSKLGLDKCQSRKLSAQVAHFNLCLMAYTALEIEGFIENQTFYKIKRNCSFDPKYADNILNKVFFQGA